MERSASQLRKTQRLDRAYGQREQTKYVGKPSIGLFSERTETRTSKGSKGKLRGVEERALNFSPDARYTRRRPAAGKERQKTTHNRGAMCVLRTTMRSETVPNAECAGETGTGAVSARM